MPLTDSEIYARLGEDGFGRIVTAFYKRVRTDDILRPMYEHAGDDWTAAEWRLREFLIGRFGGPQRYVEQRGHPRLRMRHAPFPIDVNAAKRWLQLMDESLAEAQVEEEVAAALRPYFRSTAAHMVNRE